MIDRETDQDWYEACNPLIGTRGLVPVNYFESVGKPRTSATQEPLVSSAATTLGSMTLVDREVAASRQSLQNQQAAGQGGAIPGGTATEGLRLSKVSKASGAMVYGVVQYDFNAERPDELDAKAGEAIIVIAQSNPEWFVAKPITRLGGPGLIPVSFIEVRDMVTGTPVTDPQQAVQKAGVPKVEEWKRMAASYKNSSIPLGKLGSSNENSARASVDSGGANGQGYEDGYGNGYLDQRQSQQSYTQHMAVPLSARVPRYCHHEARYWFIVEAQMDDGKTWELNREYTDFYALQTALMDNFPEEAGKVENKKRSLPFMPGPLPWVTERLTSERRDPMDRYVIKLLNLPPHITRHPIVRQFFAPRDGDSVLPSDPSQYPEGGATQQRWSGSSSHQSYPPDESRQSSTGNISYPGTSFTSPSKSVQQPQQPQSPTGYGGGKYGPSGMNQHQRGPSGADGQGMYNVNNGSGGSGSLAQPHPSSSPPKMFVRVKVKFGSDTVVLRLENDFTYQMLLDKVRDRWSNPSDGGERYRIEYKKEEDGEFYTVGVDQDPSGDRILQQARRENDKLIFRVTKEGYGP